MWEIEIERDVHHHDNDDNDDDQWWENLFRPLLLATNFLYFPSADTAPVHTHDRQRSVTVDYN